MEGKNHAVRYFPLWRARDAPSYVDALNFAGSKNAKSAGLNVDGKMPRKVSEVGTKNRVALFEKGLNRWGYFKRWGTICTGGSIIVAYPTYKKPAS